MDIPYWHEIAGCPSAPDIAGTNDTGGPLFARFSRSVGAMLPKDSGPFCVELPRPWFPPLRKERARMGHPFPSRCGNRRSGARSPPALKGIHRRNRIAAMNGRSSTEDSGGRDSFRGGESPTSKSPPCLAKSATLRRAQGRQGWGTLNTERSRFFPQSLSPRDPSARG